VFLELVEGGEQESTGSTKSKQLGVTYSQLCKSTSRGLITEQTHSIGAYLLRRITSILALVCLSGCLGWQKFSDDLQSYRLGNVDAMVARFGAPDKSVDLPGERVRVAYTWKIRNKGGEYVCDVTAIAGKDTGRVETVTDTCRGLGA
jgi:hypothetical protein